MPTTPSTQQVLQTLTAGSQPAANVGAVNNGNPNTVYNVPPQADASGNWWSPAAAPLPLMLQQLLNASYNYTGGVTVPGPVTPPPTTTPPPGTTPPPTTTPPGGSVPLPPINRTPGDGAPLDFTGASAAGWGEDGMGAWCVAVTSRLEGDISPLDAEPNKFHTLCHTPERGFHTRHLEANYGVKQAPCVTLVTEFGAKLTVSADTPITHVGASKDLHEGEWSKAKDMLNKLVYVKRNAYLVSERVAEVLDAGVQEVVKLSFEGASFPAGHVKGALIFSHNIFKGPALNPAQMAQGMDFIFAQTDMQGNTPGAGVLGANPYAGLGSSPAPAGWELGDDGLFHETTPGSTPSGGSTPGGTSQETQTGGGNGLSGFFNWLFQQLDSSYQPDPDGSINWVGNGSVGIPATGAEWGEAGLNMVFPGLGSLIYGNGENE